jgi:hypothetical protein
MYKSFITGPCDCILTKVATPSCSRRLHTRKLLFHIIVLAIALIHRYFSYEVLSDSQKRNIYDTRGEAGLSESGGMGGMDPQVRSSSYTWVWCLFMLSLCPLH